MHEDPHLMERLLAEIASRQLAASLHAGWGSQLNRLAKNCICDTAISAGLHPDALRLALLYRRKGGFIDSLRATRGLAPLDRTSYAIK
jgi:hypothetical protein